MMDNNDQIIITVLGFVVTLIAVITPLIKLNTSITTLTASVNSLKEIIQELKGRITAHGVEIDDIRKELADHDARLRVLEKN